MSFSGLEHCGKSSCNYDYYVHLCTNIDIDNFLNNLEGHVVKANSIDQTTTLNTYLHNA